MCHRFYYLMTAFFIPNFLWLGINWIIEGILIVKIENFDSEYCTEYIYHIVTYMCRFNN